MLCLNLRVRFDFILTHVRNKIGTPCATIQTIDCTFLFVTTKENY